MHRPPKPQKGKRRRRKSPSNPLSLWNIAQTIFWTSFVFACMAVGFHRRTEREQNRYIEGEIQAWRHDFNLTEAQASRIRVIEQSFYASNIILPQPAHTGAEMKEHYLKVAAEMRTEDRERFLEMENSAHPQQF